MTISGTTYSPTLDGPRLTRQLDLVLAVCLSGEWLTLPEIAAEVLRLHGVVAMEASISARLRDFRRPEHGAHTVSRRRRSGGLHEYRVRPSVPAQETLAWGVA